MRLILNLLVCCMLLAAAQSCVSKKKYDELMASKEATDQALAETQVQLQNLQTEKDKLQTEFTNEKTRLSNEITGIRSDLDATRSKVSTLETDLKASKEELMRVKAEIDGIFGAYTNSGLSLQDRNGRLHIVTAQPFNFRSSSSRLNREQREAVDQLAETLKAHPAVKVMIEGHTDSRKFAASSSMDNWDLSVKRAKAVAKRLLRQGVEPAQLTIAGQGEYDPVGDNSTNEGRSQNRRAVVRPNPDLGTIRVLGGGGK